jgi:hypothetical protein
MAAILCFASTDLMARLKIDDLIGAVSLAPDWG